MQNCVITVVSIDDMTLNSNDVEKEQFFRTLLQPSELLKVGKYRQVSDQKLSLASILLQRATVRKRFDVTDDNYDIKRTSHGKPYVSSDKFNIGDWNYNTSHHGSFVGIVSHDFCTVGIDIAQLSPRSTYQGTAFDYMNRFNQQFSDSEIFNSNNFKCDYLKYINFFVNWSLKEAMVKAIGTGLDTDLRDIEFTIVYDHDISLSVPPYSNLNGCAYVKHKSAISFDDTWEFSFSAIDGDHILTVALQSPSPAGTPLELTLETISTSNQSQHVVQRNRRLFTSSSSSFTSFTSCDDTSTDISLLSTSSSTTSISSNIAKDATPYDSSNDEDDNNSCGDSSITSASSDSCSPVTTPRNSHNSYGHESSGYRNGYSNRKAISGISFQRSSSRDIVPCNLQAEWDEFNFF